MISFNLPVCLPADFFRLMMVQLLWQKDCQTVFFYLIISCGLSPFRCFLSGFSRHRLPGVSAGTKRG